jgi:hypothetical protein
MVTASISATMLESPRLRAAPHMLSLWPVRSPLALQRSARFFAVVLPKTVRSLLSSAAASSLSVLVAGPLASTRWVI